MVVTILVLSNIHASVQGFLSLLTTAASLPAGFQSVLVHVSSNSYVLVQAFMALSMPNLLKGQLTCHPKSHLLRNQRVKVKSQ